MSSDSINTNTKKEYSNFCKLSWVIFYAFVKKGIDFAKSKKNPEDEINFSFFSDSIKINQKFANLLEPQTFKNHRFIYGKRTGKKFFSRNESSEYWLSKWSYDVSPFKKAQIELAKNGVYLVYNLKKQTFTLRYDISKCSTRDQSFFSQIKRHEIYDFNISGFTNFEFQLWNNLNYYNLAVEKIYPCYKDSFDTLLKCM